MDDIKIIDLYWIRSEDAIKETEKKYGKLCYHISNNILHNRNDVEECVNDSYLGVWNAIPPAKPELFSAFLCRIVRNLSLKKYEYIHARKRNPNVLLSFNELEDCITNLVSEDIRFNDEQLSNCINNFLGSIDSDSRNVFIRRYWFFDSIKDIMKRYQMSKGKVESMLFRTRNRLREYLKEEGFDD